MLASRSGSMLILIWGLSRFLHRSHDRTVETQLFLFVQTKVGDLSRSVCQLLREKEYIRISNTLYAQPHRIQRPSMAAEVLFAHQDPSFTPKVFEQHVPPVLGQTSNLLLRLPSHDSDDSSSSSHRTKSNLRFPKPNFFPVHLQTFFYSSSHGRISHNF